MNKMILFLILSTTVICNLYALNYKDDPVNSGQNSGLPKPDSSNRQPSTALKTTTSPGAVTVELNVLALDKRHFQRPSFEDMVINIKRGDNEFQSFCNPLEIREITFMPGDYVKLTLVGITTRSYGFMKITHNLRSITLQENEQILAS